jgi:hypothetical protein
MRTADGLAARKTISLRGGRLDPILTVTVEINNQGSVVVDGEIELEWNVNLLGGGANPAAYYRTRSAETRHDAAGSADAGTELHFGNAHEGVDISVAGEPVAPATWQPIETVSNSEAGFERVYQGSCLTHRWPLSIAPGEQRSFGVRFSVRQSRDRATEGVEGTF